MNKLHFERFKRLPQDSTAVWEAKVFRLPTPPPLGTGPEDEVPAPWAAVVVDCDSGAINATELFPSRDKAIEALADAIVRLGCDRFQCGYRPGCIRVDEDVLASRLRPRLLGSRVRCEADHEPQYIDEIVEELCEAVGLTGEDKVPSVLDQKGVTVDALSRFAEAAKAFYETALWDEVLDEELILVRKPRPPSGMKYVSVLGGYGETFGLGFFKSLQQFRNMIDAAHPSRFFGKNRIWSFQYGSIDELPLAEVDAWENGKLAVAGPEAYPLLFEAGLESGVNRPDAKRLAFVEGLLRALAATRASDLNAGQWEHEVETARGRKRYVLEFADTDLEAGVHPDQRAMETVMNQLERDLASGEAFGCPEEPSTKTALQRAQDVMYQAFDASGRRQVQLARQALEISGDCADAYVLLAQREPKLARARALYEQGVAAGERALGKECFENDAGDFWGLLETRPYMRARAGLAACRWAEGKRDEAVTHYQELLRLNPGDNQGIRYVLAGALLELGRTQELCDLLKRYEDDASAVWAYIQALVAYKEHGDCPTTRRRIREALETNRHVPDYLLGKKILPPHPGGFYSPGQDSEAVMCVDEIATGWQQTPGALDWLEEVVEAD